MHSQWSLTGREGTEGTVSKMKNTNYHKGNRFQPPQPKRLCTATAGQETNFFQANFSWDLCCGSNVSVLLSLLLCKANVAS